MIVRIKWVETDWYTGMCFKPFFALSSQKQEVTAASCIFALKEQKRAQLSSVEKMFSLLLLSGSKRSLVERCIAARRRAAASRSETLWSAGEVGTVWGLTVNHWCGMSWLQLLHMMLYCSSNPKRKIKILQTMRYQRIFSGYQVSGIRDRTSVSVNIPPLRIFSLKKCNTFK